jgi:hypothetical protein
MTRYLSILLSIYLVHMIVVIRHFHASNTEQLPYNLICLLCVKAFSQNFTGLELEDGGGRGTSGTYIN